MADETDKPSPPATSRREPSEMALPGGFGGSVKFLSVLLVLMVVTLIVGKKAWEAHRRGNTADLVSAAREAIDKKDWTTAAENIRQARVSSPDDMAVLRVMVDFLDQTGLEPGFQLQALKQLEAAGLKQPADVWVAGRACLRTGNVAGARALLEKLPEEVQTSQEALEFKAGILQQEGGTGQVLKLQQSAALQAVDDPMALFQTAALDAQSVYPEQRSAGLEKLWAMAPRADAAGLAAIRYLAMQNELSAAQTQQLTQLVKAHHDATLADELGVLSAYLRLHADQRGALIKTIVEKHQKSGLEVKIVLARWLAGEREHELLAKLIPWDIMLKSEDLFPIAIQSLAEAGRWQQMSEVLKQRTLPMTEEGLGVWRALAASRMEPDAKEAYIHLKTAVKRAAATGNFGPLRAAAHVAEELELWDLAMEAYQLLSQPKARHEMEMLEKCWGIATQMGDSSLLFDTARKQKALRPTSALYAQRLDYLRLLRGEEIESVQFPSLEVAAHEPGDSSAPAVLSALKSYRLGDRQHAAKDLSEVREVTTLSVGQRAVYAGLLALLGEPARAFQLAEKISPRLLMPEEQAFLMKAL